MSRTSSHTGRRPLRAVLVASFLTSALALTACGGTQETAASTESGAVADLSIAFAQSSAPTILDPDPTEGTTTKTPLVNVMGYFFSFNGVEGESVGLDDLVPDLATDLTTSEDGLTQTVTLRKGVLSAAGNEFTTKDVEWTLNRAIEHGAGVLGNIKQTNLDMANPITVVDDYTVEFHLTDPNSLFKNLISSIGWLDSTDITENAGDADPWGDEYLKTHTASFGPYYVTDFTPGERVVYSRNDNYWQGPSDVATATLVLIPDGSTRLQSTLSGEVDVAWIDLSAKDQLDASTVVDNWVQPGGSAATLSFDFGTSAMQDVSLRRAINWALDRDAINEAGYGGNVEPTPTCAPTAWGGTENEYSAASAEPDVERALKELEDYSGPTDLTLSVLVSASGAEEVARVVQSNLAEIGLNVTINASSAYTTYLADIAAHKNDMVLYQSYPAIQDAGFYFQTFWTTGSVYNPFGYSNEAFDTAVSNASGALDPEERASYIEEACAIFSEDAAAAQTVAAGNLVAVNKRLTNYVNLPDATVNLYNIKSAE
jgi:ABC-type transport system substrate-binding protein